MCEYKTWTEVSRMNLRVAEGSFSDLSSSFITQKYYATPSWAIYHDSLEFKQSYSH